MASIIDVHDLPEEEVRIIRELVECLRAKAKKGPKVEGDGEKVVFTAHPSDVIGDLMIEVLVGCQIIFTRRG